jgi:hypothetical protein
MEIAVQGIAVQKVHADLFQEPARQPIYVMPLYNKIARLRDLKGPLCVDAYNKWSFY